VAVGGRARSAPLPAVKGLRSLRDGPVGAASPRGGPPLTAGPERRAGGALNGGAPPRRRMRGRPERGRPERGGVMRTEHPSAQNV